MIMKDNKDDFTDWLINREDSIGYTNCKKCAKQFTCKQQYCTGLVKFSQTKSYGEVKKNDKNR